MIYDIYIDTTRRIETTLYNNNKYTNNNNYKY